jgi:hypothetical protein
MRTHVDRVRANDELRRRQRITIWTMRVRLEWRWRWEKRRVDIIVDGHGIHHVGWGGHVTTTGSHVLTVHLRVMNSWEATAVVVAVVVAITVAVLAVVATRLEVAAGREVPIVGARTRARTLNGALEKWAAVHVEEVEEVLVVLLKVLVRCEQW